MPLSDAAQALLTSRQTTTTTITARPPAPAARKPPVSASYQAFKDRAAREKERFRLATDSEYWICLCFTTALARDRFAGQLGLQPVRNRIPGPELAAAAGPFPPLPNRDRVARILAARKARTAVIKTRTAPVPDPLAQLRSQPPAGLQADAEAETAALLAAFRQPPPVTGDVLDSPHWLAVWWPSRQDKNAFLTTAGLDHLGDKYLDGRQAAALLGITL